MKELIYELEKKHFHRCNDIVNRGVNIEGKAIVAGINPGRIFVDNIDKPRSAVIWQGNLDGFIFVGDSKSASFNKEIKQYIEKVIIPQAKELGMRWFECISDHPSWYLTFEEEIFNGRNLETWNQFVYTLSPIEYESVRVPEIDREYTVQKITIDMLNANNINNLKLVETKIMEFWGSANDFFENGMGYCILHDNHIVSVCMTGFRYKNIHGIDIETIGSYQGKKLAQNAVHSFVENCFINGFIPYWDCMEVNYPSNAVAKRIGFKKEFSYKGYEFEL
ncbi:GNAT family N-acetyltransferase [Paenibacillus sp. KN14-4R]|uniref:GNAT family N-acetyltransferase n=1 Tax=Paenibacillus sp. KN14-4R TaxID=3445773 RepID=UPI003F9F810D